MPGIPLWLPLLLPLLGAVALGTAVVTLTFRGVSVPYNLMYLILQRFEFLMLDCHITIYYGGDNPFTRFFKLVGLTFDKALLAATQCIRSNALSSILLFKTFPIRPSHSPGGTPYWPPSSFPGGQIPSFVPREASHLLRSLATIGAAQTSPLFRARPSRRLTAPFLGGPSLFAGQNAGGIYFSVAPRVP